MNFNCLECGGNLVQTESDLVCINCGLVANNIFENPTIQLIKAENSFGRQYASISERPTNIKSLGTYVGTYQQFLLVDIKGSPLKISAKKQFRRLKSLNDIYLHFSGRQREYRGYKLLSAICSILQITNATKADALFLFQRIHPHLQREIKLSRMVFGSIYLSLRSRKENIELSRLVSTAQSQGYVIKGKDIIKAASLIRQHARIRVCYVKSEEYLDNILCRLQRDNKILRRLEKKVDLDKNQYFQFLKLTSKKLLSRFPPFDRGGRNPFILAAAVIIASDILLAQKKIFPHCYRKRSKRGVLTQKYIAEMLDIAEFTLREHFLLLIKPLIGQEFQ